MAFWTARQRGEPRSTETQQPQRAPPTGEVFVDALEEGEIVRVPEQYARREGLPILRKWSLPTIQKPVNKLGPKETGGMDTFRRPLRGEREGVRAALLDNFHWALSQKRRKLHLSRKQLAAAVGASEQDIKLLENGVLPSNDFVLISALERQLDMSLRNEQTANAPPATALRPARSVLAGGSVPLFGKSQEPAPAVRIAPKTNEVNEDDLLQQDDLLGNALDEDAKKSL